MSTINQITVGSTTYDIEDLHAVPSSRTVNGKALSSNISLTAEDVGAMASTYTAPVTSVNGQTGAVSIAIPSAVTESTVSGWGFTKNTGTYSKPSDGIPETDLAASVQTSLGKADSALQSFTETDPTVPSWAKASTKPTYTASEVDAIPLSKLPSIISTTLVATNWANNELTVNDVAFETTGVAYIVTPSPSSFSTYAGSVIYADDVTVSGQMTFYCEEEPTNDIDVNILKVGI